MDPLDAGRNTPTGHFGDDPPRSPAWTWFEQRMAEEMASGLSPADWVATCAWAYDQWPFGTRLYADPVLDRWVQEVSRILFTPGLREAAERRVRADARARALAKPQSEDMPYATPHPLEDDAWRVGPANPGVTHFYGWSSDFDGQPKCEESLPYGDTRRAGEDDVMCPTCEGWYWFNVSLPWLA